MAVLAHLWTQAEMPFAYLELMLCRDVYHCPPSQLPPWHKIRQHLICMNAEAHIRSVEARKAKRG